MNKQSNDFGSFKFLTGDVNYTDYGAKWVRHVGGRRYHVLELMNWAEHVSESELAETGKYNVSLSEIDLDVIGEAEMASVLRTHGYELDAERNIINEYDGASIAEITDPAYDLALVECCHGHGCKAPLSDASGNNYLKLMRSARAESRLLDDSEALAAAMEKPVNAIGSTAAEFMRGDINSAILRGLSEGDPRAELMAKLGMLR